MRNLDEDVYRQLEARAALCGGTVGGLVNEALRAWLTPVPPSLDIPR